MARANGLMISYDPNYRPTLWPTVEQAQAVIRDGFRHCQLAKISEEEWLVATGETDLHRGAEVVLAQGVQLLVISRGERGAIATNGDFWIEQPAFGVEVIETTGAGDGFVAAMITRLLPEWKRLGSLAGVSPEVVGSALRYAVAVGALTCTRKGAIPALPTAQEALEFLAHQE